MSPWGQKQRLNGEKDFTSVLSLVLYFADLRQRLYEGKDSFNPYRLFAKKIQVLR